MWVLGTIDREEVHSTNLGDWENEWIGRMAGSLKFCLESNDHVSKVKTIIVSLILSHLYQLPGFSHRSTQKLVLTKVVI